MLRDFYFRGSYSHCQILVEKSTQNEFIGKFFDVNNFGIGKSEFECIRKIRQRNIVEIFDAVTMADQYLILVYEKYDFGIAVELCMACVSWEIGWWGMAAELEQVFGVLAVCFGLVSNEFVPMNYSPIVTKLSVQVYYWSWVRIHSLLVRTHLPVADSKIYMILVSGI